MTVAIDASNGKVPRPQIVATITGIAEQTNLLALNAAVEAARAGEQGPRLRGRCRGGAQASRGRSARRAVDRP